LISRDAKLEMVGSASIVAFQTRGTSDQLHFLPKGQWQHPNVSCKWCRSPKKLLPFFHFQFVSCHACHSTEASEVYGRVTGVLLVQLHRQIYIRLNCMLHGRGGSLVTGIDHTPSGSPIRSSNWSSLFSYNTMLGRRYFLPAVLFLVIQLILISIISQQAQGRLPAPMINLPFGCKC